jgi:phage baseplate assembly protein W
MGSTMATTYLNYPFFIDGRGRTAATGRDRHIRQMIEQVLFTNPGERVNRPEFGCGLRRMVFMPNSQPLAAATQVLVKGALQQWLQNEIQVEKVEVTAVDSVLTVSVAYINRESGERQIDQFTGPA